MDDVVGLVWTGLTYLRKAQDYILHTFFRISSHTELWKASGKYFLFAAESRQFQVEIYLSGGFGRKYFFYRYIFS